MLLADEQIDWGNQEADGEVLWALTDHLGTVRDVLDNSGTVVDHAQYDAFGNRLNAAAVDLLFGYTGKPFDEATGLQNNLHRWYDPAVGRWVSEDPIGFAGGDANLSRYVGNEPSVFVDPNGLDRIEYQVMEDGIVHLYFINEGWLWNAPPVYIGTLNVFDPRLLVERDGLLVAIVSIQHEVDSLGTTDDWCAWFKKHKLDMTSYKLFNLHFGDSRFNDFARAKHEMKWLAEQAIIHLATGPFAVTAEWLNTQRGLMHSFDRHAAQWFGRNVRSATHLGEWSQLILRVARSNVSFPWSLNGTRTVCHLAKVDGKYFAVQFFAEGARAGEFATAFVPSKSQLGRMIEEFLRYLR